MRNFLRLAEGIDTMPLLGALSRHPELWDQNTLRTQHPGTAHCEVNDIWVWFNEPSTWAVDDCETIPYPAWAALPQVRPIVFGIMRAVEGVRLGRVLITRLAPGKRIYPHADGGAPAEYFSRYQVALQSLPGALFRCEDETVNFRTGEAWWFDNQREHEVINNSADDRLVLIVDVRNG
jgi:hypothetical protein